MEFSIKPGICDECNTRENISAEFNRIFPPEIGTEVERNKFWDYLNNRKSINCFHIKAHSGEIAMLCQNHLKQYLDELGEDK